MVVGFERLLICREALVTEQYGTKVCIVFFCFLCLFVFSSNKTNPDLPGEYSVIANVLFTCQQSSV